MAGTSSAQPDLLARCSAGALAMDAELEASGARLDAVLSSFVSHCREPGMRVDVSSVHGQLRAHARQAEPIDEWVGRVGQAFAAADRCTRWLGFNILDGFPSADGQEQNWLLAVLDAIAGVRETSGLANLDDLLLSRMEVREVLRLLGLGFNALTGETGHVTSLRHLYDTLIAEQFPYWKGIDRALRRIDSHGVTVGGIKFGGFTLFSLGLDIYRDVRTAKYDDNIAKAVGVNVISTSLKTAVKLNPVGATIMAANAIVQVGGQIITHAEGAAVSLFVKDDQARAALLSTVEASQEALERADIDNVIDKASETLYDLGSGIANTVGSSLAAGVNALRNDPSVAGVGAACSAFTEAFATSGQQTVDRFGTNLVETGKAVVNVPLGLVEFVGTQAIFVEGMAGHALTEGIASQDWLPDDWQNALHDAADAWVGAAGQLAVGVGGGGGGGGGGAR